MASISQRLLALPLVRWLTSQPGTLPEPDLPRRWTESAENRLSTLYARLGLGHLLEGSVFLHPVLWVMLTLALLPFLPTLAALCLCAVTWLSVVLTRCSVHSGGVGDARHGISLYSSTLRFAGLLAAVYLLAIGASVAPARSALPGLLTAAFILFSFGVYGGVATRQDLRRCFGAVILAAVGVSLYGLWQWFHPETYITGWLDEDMFSGIGIRVYSTLQNPNVLGEYFLLTIPFALALAISGGKVPGKLLWAAAAVLMCVCAVLTYSRGCYLGLILELAIFLVLLDRRFVILLAAAAVLSPFLLPDSVLTRLLSVGNMADTSTDYRFKIWQGVFAMLKDFWYCGVGPGEGAFYSVYPAYALEAIDSPHTHCLYLQLLSDTGIAGLMVFLGLAGSLLRSFLTTLRKSARRETRIFAIAGMSAFCGFLLQGLTDYSFYNYRVMLLFFGLMGLCLLLPHMDRLPERSVPGKRVRKICPLDVVVLAAALAAAVFLLGTFHQGEEAVPISTAQLMEDLNRGSQRPINPEMFPEQEERDITYVIKMTGMDPVYCENYPDKGAEIYDFNSKSAVGKLVNYQFHEREDGTVDITLRLTKYSILKRDSIITPIGYQIRVGNTVYLENENAGYMGSGTICWISH